MREIKFRGKRVDNGEWVEGSLVNNVFFHVDTKGAIPYIINPYEYEEYDCMEDIGELAVEVAPETVGQFTGLHDKNGVEVFEGDIVKSITHFYSELKEIVTVVKFNEVENDRFGEPFTVGYSLLGSEWEIIGNIHEGEQPCTSDTVE